MRKKVRIGISFGVLIVAYELFSAHLIYNLFYQRHARGSALPYLPFHRSALLGQSLAGRPPWCGLLANAMRVRLGTLGGAPPPPPPPPPPPSPPPGVGGPPPRWAAALVRPSC